MKTLTSLTVMAVVAAGAAQAGSMSEPVVETPVTPVVVEPAAPVNLGGDWTGGYVGLSFGSLSIEDDSNDDDSASYGVFGGYDYDFGRFVLGGELEYQGADDLSVNGVDYDGISRAKLRAGYDAGPALVYLTGGAAHVEDTTGATLGLGMDYKVTDNFTIGAEYLADKFDDVDDADGDVTSDSIAIRGAFRF